MSGANDKTGVGSGSGEWQTPPDLFYQLDGLFDFDTDGFASAQNHLCDTYFSVENDALEGDWSGLRMFCNPPYSRGFVIKVVEKAIAERDQAGVIVLLLPAAVDVEWYKLLEKYATIWILPKRVRFINPETGEPGTNPPTGHIIAMLHPSWMDR